eukprot:SAG31_NODE_5608_length_2425_cov_0.995701_1_plen_220_part_00
MALSKMDSKRFCVCQSRPDANRSWVGCRLCLRWFHIECVGVAAKLMGPALHWVCGDCQGRSLGDSKTRPYVTARGETASAGDMHDAVIIQRGFEKPQVPLAATSSQQGSICICNKKAEADGNFVQCESCLEWFHWVCIGLDAQTVEAIEVYICDRCTARDATVTSARKYCSDFASKEPEIDHEYYATSVAFVTNPSSIASKEFCLVCGGAGKVCKFLFY